MKMKDFLNIKTNQSTDEDIRPLLYNSACADWVNKTMLGIYNVCGMLVPATVPQTYHHMTPQFKVGHRIKLRSNAADTGTITSVGLGQNVLGVPEFFYKVDLDHHTLGGGFFESEIELDSGSFAGAAFKVGDRVKDKYFSNGAGTVINISSRRRLGYHGTGMFYDVMLDSIRTMGFWENELEPEAIANSVPSLTMTNKFHVGQRVRLLSTLEPGTVKKASFHLLWTYEVELDHSRATADYCEDKIEALHMPTSTPKFKVGDRVRVTVPNSSNIGIVGILDSKLHGNGWFVKLDKGPLISFTEDQFELETTQPMNGYVVFNKSGGITVTNPTGVIVNADLAKSATKAITECECGSGNNKAGQGHSTWCKLFKKEF